MLVTNFPGPQIPFYVLGRELTGVYPVGFLARRHALAIAIFSYNGSIHFGLLADRDTVADLETIAGYIEESRAGAARGRAGDSLQPQWQPSWQEILDLGIERRARRRSSEAEAEAERRGVFRRLRESLSKSRQALAEELSASFFDRIDEETWERLEEALILADAGAPTTAKVVERLEQEVEAGTRLRRRRGGARAPDRDPRRGRRHRAQRRSTSAASRRCC